MQLVDILKVAAERDASDVHIMAGVPPILRVHGEIEVTAYEPLTAGAANELILQNIPADKKEALDRDMQVCYSLKVEGVGYFRVAIYFEQGAMGASIRVGMRDISSLEQLGLPPVVMELARKPSGLILVTGPTGSGKTTTFNAIIDQINRERRCKIITVEDPIEFVHANKRSIIVQQEVYTDTRSFGSALIHILRQDPNVIGVGEMRDLETISTALTAAETGHLVISTLHTPDAPQTIERIIDVFPATQQAQVRTQLSTSLQAIISQQLLPRVDCEGRILATEIMVFTQAVQNIIRENKLQMLYNVITTGQSHGMQTMDSCLKDLYQRGIITYDTALTRSRLPDELRSATSRAGAVATDGIKKL